MNTAYRACALLSLLLVALPAHGQIYPSPSASGAVASDAAERSGVAEPRSWDLSMRLGFQYNDNVPHVADGTVFFFGLDDTSAGITGQIDAAYRFIQNGEWEAGATVMLNGVAWFDTGEPNDWSFGNFVPGIYVRKFFDLAGHAAHVQGDYHFTQTWLRGDNFMKQHELKASLGVELMTHLTVNAGYAIAFRDFLEEFAETALQSRSGELHAFYVSGMYWFDGNRRAVSLGYSYAISDADGANYEGDAHSLNASFISHLVGSLWLKLDGVWTFENYDNGFVQPGTVTAPGREETNIQNYRITFLYVINQQWSVDLFYDYTVWDSNQSLFSGDQNLVGFGVNFRF